MSMSEMTKKPRYKCRVQALSYTEKNQDFRQHGRKVAPVGMNVLSWTNYKISKQGKKKSGYKQQQKMKVDKDKGYGFGGGWKQRNYKHH